MKAVILAGGRGTRLSEETDFKPKPMSEIGSMPILWHIMKIYQAQGFNEFIKDYDLKKDGDGGDDEFKRYKKAYKNMYYRTNVS